MAEPTVPPAGDRPHPEYDWEAIEHSPEFQELVHKRRSWVVPATIFFLAWYFGFIVLAGYAEDFMGTSVYQGLTVGYVLALTQFAMTFGLGVWYLRKADREFDPLARRAVERIVHDEGSGGRFAREAAPADDGEVTR